MIKKKAFFPYNYWDNFAKFKEGLPSKCKFYNALTNCEINDKNYEDVLNVWKAFKMNIMNDYHDWYLKVGVLLLACVFETFREESINSFELDCAHYLFNLKLISDIEKYQFIESTLRGDISVIRKLLTYYDANKPSNIIYLDANNL